MKHIIEKTLAHICLASSAKFKDHIALAMLSDGKIIRQITYEQFGLHARRIGNYLKQVGAANGSRVLLFSENCPEWGLFYFGISLAGAVSVPLLTGFSSEQIQHIAHHADISAVCVSRSMAEKLKQSEIFQKFSHIPFLFVDSITSDEITIYQNGTERQQPLCVGEEDAVYLQRKPDDLATIIYTSGTQGNSKGVMLSGKNLISSAESCIGWTKFKSRDRIFSVLPLAHSYECNLGLIAPIMCGSSITYIDKPPSPSVLLPALKVIRPTVMATVPLFIEKIYNNTIAPKLRENKLYKFPLTRFLAILVAGRKLISALGGKIRFFGIGGAPLSQEVESFLHRARFPYATGYGLTEAAPLIAGNSPCRSPVRSTGSAPKSVSIRIAKCGQAGIGEVQVRGPNIMLGYYNDEERTAEAFTQDGWLRTGDLGSLDKKGRLFIRGRLKAVILGPAGENIYPEEIESLLGSSQFVEDALVYLGKMGELVAMVRLSEATNEAVKAAAVAIENILEELRSWVNKKLASFSRLSRIEIRYEPFEKTPTMKIKRYLYV